MPNPYHDAEGRFCSAGEMKKAIDIAAQKGDVETYFRLRTDYEAAQKDTLVVSRELFTRSLNSAHTSNLKTVDEIKAVTDAMLAESEKHARNKSPILISVLENPITPESTKNQIFEHLDEDHELKKEIIDDLVSSSGYSGRNSKLSKEDMRRLVEAEFEEPILKQAMYLSNIPFKQKVELAERYPAGYADLANRYPDKFFSKPKLVEQFETKAMEAFHTNDEKTKFAYFTAIGEHSENRELIHETLNRYYPSVFVEEDGFLEYRYSPYSGFVNNLNVSAEDKGKVLHRVGITAPNNFRASLEATLKQQMKSRTISYNEAEYILNGISEARRKPKFNEEANSQSTPEYAFAVAVEGQIKTGTPTRVVGSGRSQLLYTTALKNASKAGYEHYYAAYKNIRKDNARRARKGETQARYGEEKFTEQEIGEIYENIKTQSVIQNVLNRYKETMAK